jgi:glutamate racemase
LETALAPLPVIGVIAPGAAAAAAAAGEGPIAVIATEGTVKGGAYVKAIQALAPRMPVVQQAAPLLVPLAEEGLVKGEIAQLAVERYLRPLLTTMPRPLVLVLGCTHFPALRETIAAVAGPDIALVDSADTTALSVERVLKDKALLNDAPGGTALFLATDAPDRFANVGEIFLGSPIDPGRVEIIDL